MNMKAIHKIKIFLFIILLLGVFINNSIASGSLDCRCVEALDCKKGTGLDIEEVDSLLGYKVDFKRASVSGLSAGAYMADQLFVAYSGTFIGAGIMAGGPYCCAEGSLGNAMVRCMSTPSQLDSIVLRRLYDKSKEYVRLGKIDSLDNLRNRKIYIFSGKNDEVVKQGVTNWIDDFYKLAGVPDSNIHYKKDINTVHLLPTMCYGSACNLLNSGPPWMGDCDYDGVGKALEHIYDGNINEPSCLTKESGTFIKFKQNEFFTPSGLSKEELKSRYNFNEFGYAYVPKSCKDGGCGLHVVLHGCKQVYDRDPTASDGEPDRVGVPFGLQMVLCSGYNEYANTNNLIILYPQAQKGGSNPRGCFDWWGYIPGTTDTYATKEGPQMKAIYAMMERLKEGGEEPPCSSGNSPVITLKKTPEGNINIEVKLGNTFQDPGATAEDPEDGDLSNQIKVTCNFDKDMPLNEPGTYECRYNVADTEGCKANEKIRKITVGGCKEYTDTIPNHENEGRIYSKRIGYWLWTVKYYYAVGTDTNIPGFWWTVVTLHEKGDEPGKYYTGSCPK